MQILKVSRLIDGTGRDPQDNVCIVIEGEKIASIQAASSMERSVFNEARVLDLAGKTAIPGLIDCHVHLDLHASADVYREKDEPDSYRVLMAARNASSTLGAGVTTVRDMGARNYIDISLKRAINEGLVSGPRLLVSGRIISITASGLEYYLGMYCEADGTEQVRKAVRQQIKAGADVIKMMGTGAVMTPGEDPGAPQFNEDEIHVAVVEARKVGKRVAVHAYGAEGIKNALRAGVATIEHGTLQDDEALEMLCARGAFLVPTLAIFEHIVEHGTEGGIPEFMIEKAKWVREKAFETFLCATSMGAKVAMGTDAGTPYNFHGRNADELVLRVRLGVSPLEVIKQSTLVSAEALGLEGSIGSVEPGKLADILVLDGDPLQDISVVTSGVHMVMKGGEVVYSRSTCKEGGW